MTPLAYRIAKQSWLPMKQREDFDDAALLLKHHDMDDIHCFEVTRVWDLLDELGRKWHKAMIGADGKYSGVSVEKTFAFLPAPKTWIEWCGGPTETKGYRFGVLMKEVQGLALCTFADGVEGQFLRSIEHQTVLALHTYQSFGIRVLPDIPMSQAWQITTLLRLYAALALINSPQVIGRRQHMPHKTLVKEFQIGRFPLHAWTEIKLDVNKPPEINDGAPHEARLTGRRALHFCRKHVRIRLGKLEYVASHWRGDPAIGIRRSRYAVVKPGGVSTDGRTT